MPTLCIAMPTEHVADGNQFARCVGFGPDDDRTFNHAPNAQDANGNLYVFSQGWVGPNFANDATSPLAEPEWGCDLAAAQRIQAMIRLDSAASPDTVVAMFADDIGAVMAAMGLNRVSQDE